MAPQANTVEDRSRRSISYPAPFVVPPRQEHKQTFVLLHGRGSNGSKFGLEIHGTKIPGLGGLGQIFPHAKFIFPTASKRRAAIYNRTPINQWFDIWSLQAPAEREELQIGGLIETSAFVHALIREEVEIVGARNVILGGLSQGCAASLISLLTWDGEPLAAVVGMCGWLPFRKRLNDIAQDAQPRGCGEYGGENPFSYSDDDIGSSRECEIGDHHSV